MTLSTDHVKQGEMWQLFSGAFAGGGLFLTDGAKHAHDKRLLSAAFHAQVLHHFERSFVKHAHALCDSIDARDGAIDDLMHFASHSVLDVMFDTVFSISSDENLRKLNTFRASFEPMHQMVTTLACNPLAYFMRTAQGNSLQRMINDAYAIVDAVIAAELQDVARERHAATQTQTQTEPDKKRRHALMPMLLHLHLDGQMSLREVKQHVVTFLPVGCVSQSCHLYVHCA